MAGPFPGMDPYIESQVTWEDFHNSLISGIRTVVGRNMPANYVPRTDVRYEVSMDDGEVRTAFLEVFRLPDLELVTVVEILSPSNKSGPSRQTYLEKRQELHARKVNLVEIDLLLGGHRLPVPLPLRWTDYYAVITRGADLPGAKVYGWSVRDPLPTLPIPLKPPAADVSIHLGELASVVYEDGRYDRTMRYDLPLPKGWPIRPADREWAKARGGPAS